MRIRFAILCIVLLIDPVAGYTYNLPFQTLDGEVQNLQNYENEYVLFEIMTTWCDVCKIEMEELKKVQSSVSGLMEIISVGVDQETDTPETMQKYKIDYDVNWTFVIDHEDVFSSTFNVVSFPVMVFLGTDGNLINKWVGFTPSNTMLEEISNYLPIEYDEDEDSLNLLGDLLKRSLLVPFSIFMGVLIVIYVTSKIYSKLPKNQID